MTSRLAQSNGSASIHNTTTVRGNRILPIMSAPQQPPPPQSSGQQIPRFQGGNHRRKPPEQSVSLLQPKQSQQHAAPKDIREPPHFPHGKQDSATQNRNVDRGPSRTDSGMGLDSYSSNESSSQYLEQQAGRGGTQRMQLDSSAGSGESSGAEGMLAATGSGGSGQSRLTRKSTAEDWFNTFNRDVRGNQSYPIYDST